VSARETALAALLGVLATVADGIAVRNSTAPETVPAIVLRDGNQTDEEAIFSPLMFNITHQAEVEIIAATEAALDVLLVAVAGAITADRTLGGAVSFAHPEAPSLATVDVDGGGPAFAAQLPVTLMFTATGSPAA
jgi:hypothetical protein